MQELLDGMPNLLTPLIAVTTVWIAYQQLLTNRIQINRDLYSSRLDIYNALMSILTSILKNDDITEEQLNTFYEKKNEALFVFGKQMHEYLTAIRDIAIDLQTINIEIESMQEMSETKTAKIRQREELKKWFHKQVYVSRKLFANKMGIK